MLQRYFRVSCACVGMVLLLASVAAARPTGQRHQVADPTPYVDILGDIEGTEPAPSKALSDTVWIADWDFEGGFPCVDAGWTRVDNHILNDGIHYWTVNSAFTGVGGITGNAAGLGYVNNLCCAEPAGYDNDWYQAIRITYSGSGFVSFNYLLDSEGGFDFLQVESDSLCGSFSRVNFATDPSANAAAYRTVQHSASGYDTGGVVDSVTVPSYGPGTHCVYLAFFSDGGYSPCDGLQPSSLGRALVVDNITLVGVTNPVNEGFEGTLNPRVSFLNIQDSKPFGQWARIFQHVTDNDFCTENKSCAWLWTDHITPTLANDPSMAFAPDGYVIRNWLDNTIVSPWVSLASTPTATGTVLRFRRFPGNFFSQSRIVQNWSVRAQSTVSGQNCISGWGHASQWNSLSFFGWVTLNFDMTPEFPPNAQSIQVRHRTSDWQWLVGVPPPATFVPGPGPYIDNTRIGRRILGGPVINEGIDARSQAQDCFPTEPHPDVTPGTGEHFRPSTDRFGTAAFSIGTELGINNTSPNLITGDSVSVEVTDARNAGGITSVQWYGAITSGPHAGKAPAPWTVGPNGFFSVTVDTVRSSNGAALDGFFFVDLDDTYFRGGDQLHYLWLAQDALGGVSSDPAGLTSVPASVAEANQATGGMLEVSFLPAINWSQSYLNRIAADPNGDLDPTPAELTASTQRNCILYAQMVNSRRRGGVVNRTSFMYNLDRLGYQGHYDVYDHTGLGNTNNQLGGRARVQQAQGYNLIVYDLGNSGPTGWLMPDGSDLDAQKVDQAGWFRSWLNQVPASTAGFGTLWVLGANALEERPTAPLYATDMAVVMNATAQNADPYPLVRGQASFTNSEGCVTAFTGDEWRLDGGCPVSRDYDALGVSGTGVVTHSYRDPRTGQAVNAGAIVMRANAAQSWNTIMQSHPWFDFARKPGNPPTGTSPEQVLLQKILNCALPPACLQSPSTTDVPGSDEIAVPRQTALHQNVPNPFNPTTTIRFDLAADGPVALRIYDVAGRLVRTLINGPGKAGGNQAVTWDGLNESGERVSSGIYFYRLEAGSQSFNRKMVVMK